MSSLKDNPKDFLVGDIRLWIIVPLALMIPLNLAFWFVYVEHQHATDTEKEPQIATLWGYFQSDAFKGITVSLIIPVFMFLFERRFKILENYETARTEKISHLIKENREKRWETIKNTETMWNNLFGLASEVCFFEKSDNGKIKIKELLKKIANFTTQAEDVINDWDNRLPNISDEDSATLVNLVNYLLEPTFTVASFIEDDINKKNSDMDDLQLSLGIIQAAIKDMFHHELITILKKSIRLLEVIEDNIPEHEVNPFINDINLEIERLPDDEKEKACNIKKEIDEHIKWVKENNKNIFLTIQPDWKLLPNIDEENEDEDIKKYHDEYVKTRNFLKSKPNVAEYYSSPDCKNFSAAYYSISHELHVESSKYHYTRQGIKNFANWGNLTSTIRKAASDALLSINVENSQKDT